MMSSQKPTGKRGVAYLRVSDASKQSHQSQREAIQSYLDANGLTVVGWYEDSGSRHEAYKRPEFVRLLKDVETGHIDWVLVDIKDRFGTANIWEYGKFVCQLRDNDCELWSVATQSCISSDDAANSILSSIDSVRSTDEQVNKAVRAVRGAVSRAKEGSWQGGQPPLGYDAVCFNPQGIERWRVYYITQDKREKIYPDGQPSERYDGQGNFPSRDKGDVIRLAPSCDQQRVETIKRIFHWFAHEAISLGGICRRLNDLGIEPVNGGWYTGWLSQALRNPAFLIGQGVYNKEGYGDFREWRDGTYQEVERVKGRSKRERKREQSQFIYPKGEYRGLIDLDTWDKAQAKLKVMKRTASAPKNPDLWLAGLVYCGHCDGRMTGWSQKSDKGCPLSYTCPTYRAFGANNSNGCRLHRVNARVIEALLARYLQEAGEGLSALLTSNADDVVLGKIIHQQELKQGEFLKAVTRLWREVKASEIQPPAGQPWAIDSLCEAYQAGSGKQRADFTMQLAAKDKELTRLVDAYADLPGKLAKERAGVRLQAVEAEIEQLKSKLEALDTRVLELRADLVRLEERVREARTAITGDYNLQKAAAVGRVVRRLVCRFHHAPAKAFARSTLIEVKFEPVEGPGKAFAVDGTSYPIVYAESILGRVFSEAEICQIKLES